MRSETWIIIELGAALALMACLAFFFVPAYEKGAWFIIGSFTAAFSTVMGYKFGRALPQQANDPKDGQVSTTETIVSSVPPEV